MLSDISYWYYSDVISSTHFWKSLPYKWDKAKRKIEEDESIFHQFCWRLNMVLLTAYNFGMTTSFVYSLCYLNEAIHSRILHLLYFFAHFMVCLCHLNTILTRKELVH